MTIINMRTGSTGKTDWIFQSKSVTPTANGVYVSYDGSYNGLSSVTVNGDSDLISSNIKSGVTIFGVRGTY